MVRGTKMSNHTMAYIALKAAQKKQEEDKQNNINNQRNQAFINSTKTIHTKIPDMRTAYQSVMDFLLLLLSFLSKGC